MSEPDREEGASPEPSEAPEPPKKPARVPWVDYAKGVCIFFVVMLHCTRVVEVEAGAPGWMRYVVEFARPFRMPDFFLISGLFLSRTIDRPLRTYLDKKVVHFAYFYTLWVVIECLAKAYHLESASEFPGFLAWTWIQPDHTSLWFIYLLPVFFVVTRVVRRVPWPIVLAVAAVLQILEFHLGVLVLDRGCERFVYFYAGYIFAPKIFKVAAWFMARPGTGVLGLLIWGGVNGGLVHAGVAHDPGVSLVLGFAGALAVIMFAALLSRHDVAAPLRDWGERSIVVYLAYFIPMTVAKKVLFKVGVIHDVGTISALVTVCAVLAPLVFHSLTRKTPLKYLFERPGWAYLPPQAPPTGEPPASATPA